MKTTASLAVLVICLTACNAIVWKDCGSKGSKVKSVMVTGCEKTKVCDLPRGTNVTFTVDFITNAPAKSATSVVHGVIDHVPLPFPMKNSNACKDKTGGLICPLKPNKSYAYTPQIYVMPAFPKVKAVVRWELQNTGDSDIFCVLVPAEIVDAPKKTKDANRIKAQSNKMRPRLLQRL